MKKFYTNGITTIKLEEGIECPDGFWPGRTFNPNPQNKGLTAETSEAVKRNGQRTRETRIKRGNYISWNTGKTKETDEILALVSEKVSKTRLEKGIPAQNIGIPRTADSNQKQSETMRRLMAEKPKEFFDNIIKKSSETKRRNGTFVTSRPEETYYKELCEKYGEDDIIRQYRCDEYPFNCDFYIKSESLFIELNLNQTHGSKPFDSENEEDMLILSKWIDLSADKPYYGDAVQTWTIRDVKKLQTFRENNLNFLIVYPNNLQITE